MIPAWRTVIVHQADTSRLIERVVDLARSDGLDFGAAFEQAAVQCLDPAQAETTFCHEDRFILPRQFDKLIALIVQARTD